MLQTGLDIIGLLDRGAVFAVAHVRGGGDLADKPSVWSELGSGLKKKNSLQDFIDVAAHLVAAK